MSEEKETTAPLVFIDTAGCGLYEIETGDGESKGNEGLSSKLQLLYIQREFI